MSLDAIVAQPVAKHTATVIFAHGLGDTGAGWATLADQMGPKLPFVKWIFPTAPKRPIAVNGGMVMNAWFDIEDLTFDTGVDEEGLLQSVQSINEIVAKEVDSGIPTSRIIVGGFSQGGALAILTGLTSKESFGGIVSLSSFVPVQTKLEKMVNPAVRDVPVFCAHGTEDPIIRYDWGAASAQYLREKLQMKSVRFESYKMPHSACAREMSDLLAWFEETLSLPS